MISYVLGVVAACVLVALILVLTGVRLGQTAIPRGMGIAIGAFVLGFGLGGGLLYTLGYRMSSYTEPNLQDLANTGMYAAEVHPLEPGDRPPRFLAAGWFNGPAPSWDADLGNVMVVDLWSDW